MQQQIVRDKNNMNRRKKNAMYYMGPWVEYKPFYWVNCLFALVNIRKCFSSLWHDKWNMKITCIQNHLVYIRSYVIIIIHWICVWLGDSGGGRGAHKCQQDSHAHTKCLKIQAPSPFEMLWWNWANEVRQLKAPKILVSKCIWLLHKQTRRIY